MTEPILALRSPNYNARVSNIPLSLIVLHYTDMASGAEALDRMCAASAKVSAHYVIEENGALFQLVDDAHRAWHAGVSFWRGMTDINSASLGIELVNPGQSHGYRSFPAVQIATLKELLGRLVARHGLCPKQALVGHSDIAPDRKQDPGELFPWQELAQSGFGLWPRPTDEDRQPLFLRQGQLFLRRIGYDCPTQGTLDPATESILRAFQRRYLPQAITGQWDTATAALAAAVARQCPVWE